MALCRIQKASYKAMKVSLTLLFLTSITCYCCRARQVEKRDIYVSTLEYIFKKYDKQNVLVSDQLTFIEMASFFEEFQTEFKKTKKETMDSLTELDNRNRFAPERSERLRRLQPKLNGNAQYVVYLSKPYNDYLIAEIINYHPGEKTLDLDMQRRFNGGEQYLFKFDEKGGVLNVKVIPVNYD